MKQLPLFDKNGTPIIAYTPEGHARQTDPDTSHEATSDKKNIRPTQCRRILNLIKTFPNGMICEELEQATGWAHQSVSRRITDLKEQGFVVDSGARRRASSDRNQIVWISTTASSGGAS